MSRRRGIVHPGHCRAISFMSRDDVMQQWQSDATIATVPVKKALFESPPWSDLASGWKPIIDVLRMPGNRPKPSIPKWGRVHRPDHRAVPLRGLAPAEDVAGCPDRVVPEGQRLAGGAA